MPKRTISLLTDFGSRSPYPGILKGVILGINPEANVVDLSHEVTPYAIEEAAFLLDMSWRYLPPRTIHLVVVDPGVGSSRRLLLAIGERDLYLAPDNGVLSYVAASDSIGSYYELNATHYFLQPVSSTFHGRDILAPVAGWLSTGIDPGSIGDPITDPVVLELPRPRVEGSTLVGQVLYVDRFGNLVTNMARSVLEGVLDKYGLKGFLVGIDATNTERHVEHFQQAERGMLGSIYGSSGYLEVFQREGNAAQRLGAGIGAPVVVRFHK